MADCIYHDAPASGGRSREHVRPVVRKAGFWIPPELDRATQGRPYIVHIGVPVIAEGRAAVVGSPWLGTFKFGAYLVIASLVLALATLFTASPSVPTIAAILAFVGCLVAAGSAERFQRAG